MSHKPMEPIRPRPAYGQREAVAQLLGNSSFESAAIAVLLEQASQGSSAIDLQALAVRLGYGEAEFSQAWSDSDLKNVCVSGSLVALPRLFEAEHTIAQRLAMRMNTPANHLASRTTRGLSTEQAAAVQKVLQQSFCVVTGGPGTGKTRTIAAIVEALLDTRVEPQPDMQKTAVPQSSQAKPQSTRKQVNDRQLSLWQEPNGDTPLAELSNPPAIGMDPSSDRGPVWLLAPTGKAAARIAQSLAMQQASAQIRQWRSESRLHIATVHRALAQARTRSSWWMAEPYRDQLNAATVIIDEASMLSAELFAQLLRSLRDGTRVVLVGDPLQLPAIEPGGVLHGWMGFGIRNDERWVKHTAELSRNFRSEPRNDDSKVSLDAVASVVRSTALPKTSGQTQAIQSQVIEELLQAIEISDETDRDEQAVKWRRIKTDADTAYSQAVDQAMKHYDALVRQCLSTLNSTATHAVLAEFRVLAARRDGAYGIERLNHDIEQRARRLSQREGRQANDALYPVTAREWFIGRVVMVRENSRSTGLANGDVGVYLADGYVHFEQYEVEDSTPEGTPRRAFLPSELPLYEVAYAITIHKAQGSEFQEVLVMCDGDTATRSGDSLSALNHALIYTAITRAKRGVALYASHQTLLNGLLNQKSLVSALPLLLQAQL